MKSFLLLLILGTSICSSLAECQSTDKDWYECVGLNSLDNVPIPDTAKGIKIYNSTLATIPTGSFSRFGANLLELNLTNCQITKIEPGAFQGLTNLTLLGLDHNEITSLDAGWIKDLPHLKSLILWKNGLREITPEVFELLSAVETLDIAYNQFYACLPTEMLKKLTNLKRILISSNPWFLRCRSAMSWYLGSNHIQFVKDWAAIDTYVEECLAHEYGADQNETILEQCVDKALLASLPINVRELKNSLQALMKKYFGLEAELEKLKKSISSKTH